MCHYENKHSQSSDCINWFFSPSKERKRVKSAVMDFIKLKLWLWKFISKIEPQSVIWTGPSWCSVRWSKKRNECSTTSHYSWISSFQVKYNSILTNYQTRERDQTRKIPLKWPLETHDYEKFMTLIGLKAAMNSAQFTKTAYIALSQLITGN